MNPLIIEGLLHGLTSFTYASHTNFCMREACLELNMFWVALGYVTSVVPLGAWCMTTRVG
jgi:hypothetical protein